MITNQSMEVMEEETRSTVLSSINIINFRKNKNYNRTDFVDDERSNSKLSYLSI